MSDALLRQLERAWQADPEDEAGLDRFLAEARRAGLDPVERLAEASDAPWAGLLRASLPIVRTRPEPVGGGEALGRRLFAFVENGAHFHTHIDVYEDGAVDAWGFMDRALFGQELAGTGRLTPPIVTAAPSGAQVSVHNLVATTVRGGGSWSARPSDLGVAVDRVLRALATPGRPLLDLGGEATVQVGRHRQRKLGVSDALVHRRAPGAQRVRGTTLPLFARQGSVATLEPWIVYEDGLTQVGSRGPLRTIEEAGRRLLAGELATRLRSGDRLVLPGLGAFDVQDDPTCYVDPVERVREAQDELAQLEGGPGTIARCIEAFAAFGREEERPAEDPARSPALEAARERLREAYEAVPEHLRRYVGDMDSKDWPVREALGLA